MTRVGFFGDAFVTCGATALGDALAATIGRGAPGLPGEAGRRRCHRRRSSVRWAPPAFGQRPPMCMKGKEKIDRAADSNHDGRHHGLRRAPLNGLCDGRAVASPARLRCELLGKRRASGAVGGAGRLAAETRLADVIGNAVHVVRIVTGEAEEGQEPENPAAVLGRKGGAARARDPTPSSGRRLPRRAPRRGGASRSERHTAIVALRGCGRSGVSIEGHADRPPAAASGVGNRQREREGRRSAFVMGLPVRGRRVDGGARRLGRSQAQR